MITIGYRIGKLEVVAKAESRKKGKRTIGQWLCKCDCGNEVTVPSPYLKKDTTSCGCLRV